GRPDCGYLTNMFLEPKDVSFHGLQVHELDDPWVATGFYAKFNGQGHRIPPGTSAEAIVLPAQPSIGSMPKLVDEVYSGDSGIPGTDGREVAPANCEWRLASAPSATGFTQGNWQKFPPPQQEQVAVIPPAGAVTLTKGTEKATTKMWDKPSTY